MTNKGIKILKVKKGSAAARAGLTAGDILLAINDHPIDDELALKFYLSEEKLKLRVKRPEGLETLNLYLPDGTGLGMTVEDFRTKTCNNACLFCFVDQLPDGIRPNLRVKDDDYRLSFLHGNYITLTNVSDSELNRIIEQRLSPLYVSVHATDPDIRTCVLGRKKADNLGRKLTDLVRGGIQIHAQVVLMPGINDGANFEKTVFDLYRLYPGVQSVAVVPLGLSKYGKPKDRLIPVTPGYCREIISSVIPWQKKFRAQIDRTFACLADEFYIQGRVAIPERDYYDDFAQIEDGVGMVRSFLDEFEVEMHRRHRSRSTLQGTLVTGRLFAPTLSRCISQFNSKFGSSLHVCEAVNHFLGRNITVAGLLSGQDILTTLDGRNAGKFVIIPGEAISQTEGILIDNLSVEELSARLGKPVYAGGRTVGDFFRLLFDEI